MTFSTPVVRDVILVLLFSAISFNIFAQFELKTERFDANYDVGETIQFQIDANQSGTASYKLKYDNKTDAISEGSLTINAGTPSFITHQQNTAEVVICEVTFNNTTKITAAAVGRADIAALADEPSDFDQFWETQKSLASSIPLDPQLSYYSNENGVTSYKISIANIDNRRLYGYISIPDNADNLPAIITFPPYSSAPNTPQPQILMAERANVIAVSLSVHNAPVGESDPSAYDPNFINDREGYYYRYTILGAVRMIDYLFTRDDFDGENIAVTGVSQGGGLAISVAGLDQRVKALSFSNPALCRHQAFDSGRASSFPYYLEQSALLNGDAQHYAETKEAAAYYDAVNFAKKYRGPVLGTIGYIDDVTPAAASFAAINAFSGTVITAHAIELDHNHPSEYWNGQYDLWRRIIPSTQQPPYFTSTGRWIDAGEDATTMTSNAIELQGLIFDEETTTNAPEVKWKLISGPGNVDFNNSNSYTPTATFDSPGEYTLQFSAVDYEGFASDKVFHSLHDRVVITVTANPDENPDTEAPNCQLALGGFANNGALIINVEFSEAISGLTTDDFTIENCQIIDISGGEASYQVQVLPLAAGFLRIKLDAAKVNDAAGNLNTPSNQLNIYITNPPVPNNSCDNVVSGGSIIGDESSCEAFAPNLIGNLESPQGGSGSIIYKWQSSPSLSGTWSDIPEATLSSYEPDFLEESRYYRRLSKREGCEEYTGISNPVLKSISATVTPTLDAPTGYCEMQGNTADDAFITEIKLANLLNNSGAEGYGDFTNQTANLAPGSVYTIELTPGDENTQNNWVGWIDYNRDGDFNDSRELFAFKSGTSTVQQIFEIPAEASVGATRMRIALRKGSFPAPCFSYEEGEVEDYTIIIGEPAGTPNNNNDDDNSPDELPEYCSVSGSQPWWQWIENVEFADLENNSFKERYGDFTDRFAQVETGNTYEITLTPGYSWLENELDWRVWIDFNADGDFDDPNELVGEAIDIANEVNLDITIPNNALEGTTAMRIGMSRENLEDACTNVQLGEFEDYSIIVRGCSGTANRYGELLDLTAYQNGRAVDLHWLTNTEYKNQSFVLERSSDGVIYEEIDQQESTNKDYLPNVYLSSDPSPMHGLNMFRVKQIYESGDFAYSDVKKVWFNIDLEAISPYPNPTQEYIYLPLQKYEGERAEIKIYDNFARLLKTSTIEEIKTEPMQIDLEGLQDGLYYISINIIGYRKITRKFTVFRI